MRERYVNILAALRERYVGASTALRERYVGASIADARESALLLIGDCQNTEYCRI